MRKALAIILWLTFAFGLAAQHRPGYTVGSNGRIYANPNQRITPRGDILPPVRPIYGYGYGYGTGYVYRNGYGRVAETVVGATVGTLIGGAINRSIERNERRKAEQADPLYRERQELERLRIERERIELQREIESQQAENDRLRKR